MARRSSARLASIAAIAALLYLVAPVAFLSSPSVAASQHARKVGGAAVISGAVLAPQVASAAEQAYDQFSPAELVAITIPFVLVALSYSEWEGYQIPTDQELGPGTLRKARNGPGGTKGATLMGDSPEGFEIK
mmetsp:Transcript_74540/g.139173  ORF Transcript_74540/g.139173 Transcript_74540/m.139173 type:complete len:133 (-) Transcript_74540:49-447(-)